VKWKMEKSQSGVALSLPVAVQELTPQSQIDL
jgi:hypothetical protein